MRLTNLLDRMKAYVQEAQNPENEVVIRPVADKDFSEYVFFQNLICLNYYYLVCKTHVPSMKSWIALSIFNYTTLII